MESKRHPGGHPGGRNKNRDTPYTPEERLEIIKLNIGKSYEALRKLCKCSMSTIYLDMKSWRASGGFEDFLQKEFLELHELMKKKDPTVSYKTVSILLGKYIIKKIEAGVTVGLGDQFTDLMRDAFGVEREDDGDAPGDTSGESVEA